jgi:hypothetical protein
METHERAPALFRRFEKQNAALRRWEVDTPLAGDLLEVVLMAM